MNEYAKGEGEAGGVFWVLGVAGRGFSGIVNKGVRGVNALSRRGVRFVSIRKSYVL